MNTVTNLWAIGSGRLIYSSVLCVMIWSLMREIEPRNPGFIWKIDYREREREDHYSTEVMHQIFGWNS